MADVQVAYVVVDPGEGPAPPPLLLDQTGDWPHPLFSGSG